MSALPHKAGVYIFKDKDGNVLYVGKAIDLYHRVTSYFGGNLSLKTRIMVEKISALETIVVESELEALILEANLIKKYLPKFNIRLTDDKDYLYIGITKEDFPKVLTLRKQDLKKVKKFFGPFPSSRTVRDTLKLLRRVFPWCNGGGGRACFYYHLGLCPGACMGLISPKDYYKIIKRFSKFMDGKKEEIVGDLTEEMMKNSRNQRFEAAAKNKKIIEGIRYITHPNRTRLYLENPNFLEEETKLALQQLKTDLNLPKLPERVEGYDISNIQGKNATGSMVVLTDGEVDKSQYRRFKIHMSGRPNDVGMLREMIKRRLNHPEWSKPDLILVDGGRGQVRGVWETMKQFNNLTIPIFGLAKKMEWLYPPEGEIIKLSKKSLSLKLLQKLRDEAHRFAVSYHRRLHGTMLFR